MPKTRIACPNCRQPITAEIDQLLDVGADPSAKQRLFSGAINLVQCPSCGYRGNIATPLVYHDPDKELLLTFVPPEIGLPRNEQEKVLGSYIQQAVSRLPQEKRKAYLFRPQEALTLQGLIERVLEADGITREMIQAQQQKVNLIQRLMTAKGEDVQAELARQEDKLVDAEFFAILRQLMETALMSGNQEAARRLSDVQKAVLPVTTYGREVQAQAKEVEAAIADLKAAGKELTREKLLQLVIAAPSEIRLQTFVNFARPAMDYAFFQLLSERMERAGGDEKNRLVELRQKLLQLTREVDLQVEAHVQETRQLLESILQLPDPLEAMNQVLPAIDEYFLQELNTALESARQKNDLERLAKLQKIVDFLQEASVPPEATLIEELLSVPDEEARQAILEAQSENVTPELISALSNIVAQADQGEDQQLAANMRAIYRQALRFSMGKNM